MPDRTALTERLKPVTLSIGQAFGEPGAPIEQVIFPTSGLISIVTELSSGERIETALIGRSGVLGASVAFGAKFHISTSFVQMPGDGLVMRAADFADFARQHEVRELFYKNEEYLLAQSQQSVACNARHQVAMRLATWLIRSRDAANRTHLQMTQEFLAQMLGVQRASVSLVAAELQGEGLIRYRRGNIEIVNEQKLIERACECCQAVRTQYRRLFDGSGEQWPA
jgi:CRP-like cAMP-binding protein